MGTAAIGVDADRLVLDSGDVLTGDYVGRENGKILFDSVLMGLIRVDGRRATVEEGGAEDAPLPGAEGWVEVVLSDAEADMPGPTDRQAAQGEAAVAAEEEEEPAGWWSGWTQQVRLGYNWESAESWSDDLSVRYQAERSWEGGSFRVAGRYEYSSSKAEGAPRTVVRDRWAGSLRYRSDIGERWFVQVDGDYKRDEIQEIAHEVRQNTGLGWRAWPGDDWQLTLLPQVTVRYLELMREQPGWNLLLSLRQDIRWQVHERIILRQSAGLSWDPEDQRRSNYDLELRVENRLTEDLFLDLAYELEFDYQLDRGIDGKTERAVVLIGYEF